MNELNPVERKPRLGRDNIYEELKKNPNLVRMNDAEYHLGKFLEAMAIDWRDDPSMNGTPKRVAKMFRDVMHGRYEECPVATEFPNTLKIDHMYVVGPIDIRSMCSHHLVPIIGKAWVGLIPDPTTNILGLSKFARIADWIFARPHMQEEATKMFADEIEKICKPIGLAVMVRAKHGCTIWRGVKAEHSAMVTSEMRGVFQSAASRSEFLSIIKGLEF